MVLLVRSSTIILTADETMMSTYRGGMFLGFSTCAPRGILPDWFFFFAFAPPVVRKNGRAVFSDLGLRTIEAALIRDGFSEEEVAVVHPLDFKKMIGDETRIVAIGAHDPLGINPPTSTFVDIARTGPPYNRVKFLELMKNPYLSNLTTIVGGKGAWQVSSPEAMEKLHIDHIHMGMGDVSMPRTCRQILNGEEVPRIIMGEDVPADQIPNIIRPTVHGLVEVSRGCGRGCAFCTPGNLRVVHKPIDHIVRDVEVNVRAGNTTALLHSEDVLCYGSKGIAADPEKVIHLVDRVLAIEGVEAFACSHIALATAYHHPELVDQISEKVLPLPKETWIGAQTGIETGSPRLMERHMRGKCLPAKPDKWHDIVVGSLSHLSDAGWVLACTMVVGLPGETEEDILMTQDLVEELKDLRVFLVPMNFVAMGGSGLSLADSFTVEKMTPAHWALLGSCIEHDVRLARDIKDAIYTGS
ncbi:MAG TPA: radical SAM protein, partial [Methanomicrobiales archaeon]|nr:radical SAM protein [Methanomicrobiales archaeon]